MMINTYVINLKDSVGRKAYIEKVFEPYRDVFNLKFVEAVDCRKLTDDELSGIFDLKGAFRNYGRYLRGGEIGCTLSHRKCCREMLDSGDDVALIIEDDLMWKAGENVDGVVVEAVKALMTERPVLILLSGDYWYTSIKDKGNGLKLANVREAVSSHAYMVNRAAAERILSMPANYLADDWYCYKRNIRIKIYGTYPHIADQNFVDVTRDIVGDYACVRRKNMPFAQRMHSFYRGIIKHVLYYTKHFHHKD